MLMCIGIRMRFPFVCPTVLFANKVKKCVTEKDKYIHNHINTYGGNLDKLIS